MLDEIDKVGVDFRGDPTSALLEVLDPEQNNAFSDHYLEIPYDLSKVIFIATANQLDPIPTPLRDRMEVIEIGGYTEEEKLGIARGFLVPKQCEYHGLKPGQLTITDAAVTKLVRHYTREAGVRNLEREIASLCRKVARKVATETEDEEQKHAKQELPSPHIPAPPNPRNQPIVAVARNGTTPATTMSVTAHQEQPYMTLSAHSQPATAMMTTHYQDHDYEGLSLARKKKVPEVLENPELIDVGVGERPQETTSPANSLGKIFTIDADDVATYLGPERFTYGQGEEHDEIGVATGVAWTPTGGDILSIEVLPVVGKGNLQLTGQLGDVMKESAQTAMSYARSRAEQFGVDPAYFENHVFHIHVPEGAVPKDGPSAGITLTTALISAMTGTPVRCDVAMTGEVTLRGKVLAIGGLKEKTLAAHRAGIKKFILPKENAKDITDLPEKIRQELDLIPVTSMDEVLQIVLQR
jgi:endopeptidase La